VKVPLAFLMVILIGSCKQATSTRNAGEKHESMIKTRTYFFLRSNTGADGITHPESGDVPGQATVTCLDANGDAGSTPSCNVNGETVNVNAHLVVTNHAALTCNGKGVLRCGASVGFEGSES
jgi:hypothetical protein